MIFLWNLFDELYMFDFGQTQCEIQERLKLRLRRDVLYMTLSGRGNGGDVASCCLNGPKGLLLFVIEGG